MLEINVNNRHDYRVEIKQGELKLGDKTYRPDLVKTDEDHYHLLLNGRSFRIRILGKEEKQLKLEINGNRYSLKLKDPFAQLLHRLGMDTGTAGEKLKEIKAPMPGLVLKILVKAGETVSKDSQLLILEAMKMENVLRSPSEGQVTQIMVKERDAVEKGQVLISFH